YAFLVMHVPLFSSHLCYTQKWLNTSLGKIKNTLSPKKVLSAAIGLLPLGKIKYLWKGEELAQDISDSAKSPKVLQDQKPIIDTKYNPDTGTYEPIVDLKPRDKPLKPSTLLEAPTGTTSAQDLVGTSPNLKDFLNSPFASKGDLSTEADLTDAVTEFNLDHNLRAGTQTKIADDLREIFNRSKPQEKANFPITIKDNVGEDPEIPAEVQRTVTPVPNNPNAYNVEYIITPKNAPAPVTINYYVTKAAATSPAPTAAASPAPAVVATPTYKLGQTKYVGKEIIIKKNTSPGAKGDPTTPKNTPAKTKVVTPNYNSFVNPAQNAITTAFNYKISLFTCPSVSPKCPNSIEIDWNNMGINGKYKIPDPMCAVITAINNPTLS
uniref:hypothetical protein n=1 Tax=Thermococcus sp. TaxID=35749 RepID=UPI0026092804